MNNLICTPQNDLNCYYNIKKKYGYRQISKITINNFITIQNSIDDKFFKFIINAEMGSDPILNNLIRMRDSFFTVNEHNETLNYFISSIHNVSNIVELASMIRVMTNLNIPTLFTAKITSNFKHPDVYVLELDEISLTVTSNEIDDIFIDEIKYTYNFITNKCNYNLSVNAHDFIKNIIIFELLFFRSILNTKDSQDPNIAYNSDIYDIFLEKYDSQNFWKTILEPYVKKNDYISYPNIIYLKFLKRFLEKMTRNELEMIKYYLIYCLIKKYSPYILYPKIIDDPNETSQYEMMIITDLFYETFGYYLESIYELNYADEKKKDYVTKMFDKMKKYCINFFKEKSSMENTTKQEALRKLETMEIIVGKQEYHIDLSELPTLGNNFYNNLFLVDSFYFRKMLNLLGKPIKKKYLSLNNEFFSFLINAYYDVMSNVIYIPTSILGDVFLNIDVDPIYNYGSIGSIIGHENNALL